MNAEKTTVCYTPESLEFLPYPAYLLDENRIIRYRNKLTQSKLFPLNRRMRLDKLITKRDRERVNALKVGQETFISISTLDSYGAMILRQEDGYCLALRNITAQMMSHVSDLATRLPSFFGDSEEQICALRLSSVQTQEEMIKVRQKYNRALRCQTGLATYFRVTSGKVDKDSITELATPVNALLEYARKVLLPNGTHLKNKLREGTVYALANSDDFCYAVATVLSVAAENLYGNLIYAETHVMLDEYTVSIRFEPNFDEETYRKVLSRYYREDVLCGPYRNMFFDLLLVQMLAEASGWQFRVTSSGCSDGMLSMTLAVPLSPACPPMFHSAPDPMPLVEMQLVEVLGTHGERETPEQGI